MPVWCDGVFVVFAVFCVPLRVSLFFVSDEDLFLKKGAPAIFVLAECPLIQMGCSVCF